MGNTRAVEFLKSGVVPRKTHALFVLVGVANKDVAPRFWKLVLNASPAALVECPDYTLVLTQYGAIPAVVFVKAYDPVV